MVQFQNLMPNTKEYHFDLGVTGLKCIARLVVDEESCKKACKTIEEYCAEYKAVGFDAEWRPSFTKGVSNRNPIALLQIATPQNGIVYLFRLHILRPAIPDCLRALLENNNIIKVGVSPKTDSDKLQIDYKVSVRGALDLRLLYNTTKGLASLSKEILNVELAKGPVTISNWEQKNLTLDQIRYAASDALASLEIFKKWPTLMPGLPWSKVAVLIAGYVDVPFKKVSRVIGESATCSVTSSMLSMSLNGRKLCVVCGVNEGVVVKKNILPKSYKKFFPKIMITAGDFSTLPLCLNCESKSHFYIQILHEAINYVLDESLPSRYFNRCVLKHVAKRMGKSKVIANFMEESLSWKKLEPPLSKPRGKATAELYEANNVCLSKLQQLWREMFLEAMEPQFLPRNWSID